MAEFWDMKEQYKLLFPDSSSGGGGDERSKRSAKFPSRPSCSVIFKHLPDRGDVLMGHNTWHEYRAMSFR